MVQPAAPAQGESYGATNEVDGHLLPQRTRYLKKCPVPNLAIPWPSAPAHGPAQDPYNLAALNMRPASPSLTQAHDPLK